MEIDRLLSWLTRALNRRIPMGRRLRPLREFYSRYYANRPDRWVVISDYRRKAKIKLDRSAYMGSAIYWHDSHHRVEMCYLENNLQPGDVLLDVGANIGEFTVGLAPLLPNGRVFAFEPQPDVRKVLEESVALNGFSNVCVLPFGLAEKYERQMLFTSADVVRFGGFHEGLYSRFPDRYRTEAAGVVEFQPLDQVLKEHGIQQVDWIKADIEGGELYFLRGAQHVLRTMRPKLLIEVNEATFEAAGYSVRDIAAFLDEFGYKPWQLAADGRLHAYRWDQGGTCPHNVFCLPQGE